MLIIGPQPVINNLLLIPSELMLGTKMKLKMDSTYIKMFLRIIIDPVT